MQGLLNKSILIVDDDSDIRDLLEGELSIYGYAVVCASNGQQALELLEEKKFDLILSDVRMPIMDGIKMIELLQKRRKKMPLVLMMSAYSNQSESEMREKGAVGLIHKPFRLKQLITKIDELFRAEARDLSRNNAA